MVSENLTLVSVHMNPSDLKDIEKLIEENKYPNRSEFIRFAVKILLKMEDKTIKQIGDN